MTRIHLTYNSTTGKVTLSIPASFEDLSHKRKLEFINESYCLLNQKFIELMDVWVGKSHTKYKESND